MFTDFLIKLAQIKTTNNLCNPYAGEHDWAKLCRTNLQLYLEHWYAANSKVILVGEALGYRGGRVTGIPFVSPHILQTALPFSLDVDFQWPTEWPHIQREATATMMWDTLTAVSPLPLLWNAFPFHPHKPNQPQSNRPPTQAELQQGKWFINRLIEMFEPEIVVAVGNKAAGALERWGYSFEKVRHPSYGGKRPFQTALLLG